VIPTVSFIDLTYLTATALNDGGYRVRLAGVFGPLQRAGVLSFSQLVDILCAWRGLVKTASSVVGQLVALTGCALITPDGAVPSEPLSDAA
jgi:hypothetical protein